MFIHPDDIWGMRNGDIGGKRTPRKFEHQRFVTAQDQSIVGMLSCPAQRARDHFSCTVISAHRVECEADSALCRGHPKVRLRSCPRPEPVG